MRVLLTEMSLPQKAMSGIGCGTLHVTTDIVVKIRNNESKNAARSQVCEYVPQGRSHLVQCKVLQYVRAINSPCRPRFHRQSGDHVAILYRLDRICRKAFARKRASQKAKVFLQPEGRTRIKVSPLRWRAYPAAELNIIHPIPLVVNLSRNPVPFDADKVFE